MPRSPSRAASATVAKPSFPSSAGSRGRILVGCAGWALPRDHRRRFPAGDSNLERYAARFCATEINSSFYRTHQESTYARWSEAVPREFRFSVKVPQRITHDLRLVGAGPALGAFLDSIQPLGGKLGCLLMQFPPSFAYEARVAGRFLRMLRKRYAGSLVAEPRHASWFTEDAERALISFQVARAAADPARTETAHEPGGWPGVAYFRLHGSPVMYRSSYEPAYLAALARKMKALAAHAREVWCIFDNTMLGAASANALDLSKRFRSR